MIVTIDQYTPTLRVTSEYKADNITVIVEWTQQVAATYTVSVIPLALINFTGSTSRQLTISYNTEYNFSVEATVTAPCRVTATAFIILHYGEMYHIKYLSLLTMSS